MMELKPSSVIRPICHCQTLKVVVVQGRYWYHSSTYIDVEEMEKLCFAKRGSILRITTLLPYHSQHRQEEDVVAVYHPVTIYSDIICTVVWFLLHPLVTSDLSLPRRVSPSHSRLPAHPRASVVTFRCGSKK